MCTPTSGVLWASGSMQCVLHRTVCASTHRCNSAFFCVRVFIFVYKVDQCKNVLHFFICVLKTLKILKTAGRFWDILQTNKQKWNIRARLTSCFVSRQKLLFLFPHRQSASGRKTCYHEQFGRYVRGLSEVRLKLIWSSYSTAVIIWYIICFRAQRPPGASGTHNHTFLIGLPSWRTLKSVVPSRMP